MSKNEFNYDPEFPFVIPSHGREIIARFKERHMAEWYAKNHPNYHEVVDTAPKPKIPEGAQYVTWTSEDQYTEVASRVGDDWAFAGDFWTLEGLVEEIGDAEVTVLVPKEGT